MIYDPVSSETLTALTSLRKHYPWERAGAPSSRSTYNISRGSSRRTDRATHARQQRRIQVPRRHAHTHCYIHVFILVMCSLLFYECKQWVCPYSILPICIQLLVLNIPYCHFILELHLGDKNKSVFFHFAQEIMQIYTSTGDRKCFYCFYFQYFLVEFLLINKSLQAKYHYWFNFRWLLLITRRAIIHLELTRSIWYNKIVTVHVRDNRSMHMSQFKKKKSINNKNVSYNSYK